MHVSLELIMLVVIVGAVTGWLADRSQYGSGYGLAGDATIGAIGAAIGLWAFPRFGVNADPWTTGSLVAAVVGAAVLLVFARVVPTGFSAASTASDESGSKAPNLGHPAEAVSDATARSPNLGRPTEAIAGALARGPNLARPAEAVADATSRGPNWGKPAEAAAAGLAPSRGSFRSSADRRHAPSEPRGRAERPEPRQAPQRDVPQPRTWSRAS